MATFSFIATWLKESRKISKQTSHARALDPTDYRACSFGGSGRHGSFAMLDGSGRDSFGHNNAAVSHSRTDRASAPEGGIR
jgi:hypothetical protein